MYANIAINSMEDINSLYNIVSKHKGEVYISTQNSAKLLNARSILGLTSLVGQSGLKLVFPDHCNANNVLETMKKIRKAI